MKNSKTIVLFILILSLTSGCSLLGKKTTEQAPYKLLNKDGSFEIREYPSIILARVKNSGEVKVSQSESFRELFNYISGENISQQKISMIAPVLIKQELEKESASEQISMTAPVLIKNNEMSFVLPSKYSFQSVPKPKSDKIEIAELKGAKRLVYTFSGILNPKNVEKSKSKLFKYIDQKNLKTLPSTLYSAGYNPPWTLPFLRRNEILIELQK